MDAVPQDDLTNLNWVAGISVPITSSVSPPNGRFPHHRSSSKLSVSSQKDLIDSAKKSKKDTKHSLPNTRLQNGRNVSMNVDEYGNKKPNCSYACLIAMALRAAANSNIGGCLPVHEIYKCIEDLFPFFKNAPDGWKNSVRHNLSLGTTFRKVLRNEDWQGKKGYFWEIAPNQSASIDNEMERFLVQEGQTSEVLKTSPSLSVPTSEPSRKNAQPGTVNKSSTTKSRKSKLKRTPTARPSKVKQWEELPRPEIAIFSPQMQAQLKKSKTPVTPNTVPTLEVFDSSSTPSQFVGIQTPQSDDTGAARELFGNGSATDLTSNLGCMYASNGEVMPISTTPACNMYGIPTMVMGYADSSSPIMGISPASSDGTSPFVSPQCVPFVPMGMFPQMFVPPYCWGPHSGQCTVYPTCHPSFQTTGEDTYDVFESEDPFDFKQMPSSSSNKKRKKSTTCHSRKKIKISACSRRLQFDEIEQDSDSMSCAPSTPPPPSVNDRRIGSCHEDSLLPNDRQQDEIQEEIQADSSSQIVSCLTEARKFDDEYKPQAYIYATPLIDIHGLSRDKIRELEEMVGSTTELDSLFSSTQSSLHTTPDRSIDHQSTCDSEASPSNLEYQGMRESIEVVPPEVEVLEDAGVSALCTSTYEVVQMNDEASRPDHVPALNSLLNLADASIVNIEEALNV